MGLRASNIKQVEATGAKVLWITANPATDISLVDPKQVARSKTETDRIKQVSA
jgi:hypothetical protein